MACRSPECRDGCAAAPGARSGFEVVYFQAGAGGWGIEGWTTAVEDGDTWVVEYAIELDAGWATRSARIQGRSRTGSSSRLLEADGAGRWLVDGERAAHLDGCLDVDLESSAMTNALPVHRMALPAGARKDAPAAYVRAAGLGVERLEQTYSRAPGQASRQCFDDKALVFGFSCRLRMTNPVWWLTIRESLCGGLTGRLSRLGAARGHERAGTRPGQAGTGETGREGH